jgi:hypothetical protein
VETKKISKWTSKTTKKTEKQNINSEHYKDGENSEENLKKTDNRT